VNSAPSLGRLGRFKLKRADSSLAGVYASAGLACENTLIELFDAKRPLFEAVTGGLVFSFDSPGSSQRSATALTEGGVDDVRYELVRRARSESEEKQPWYHLLQPGLGTDSPFVLFLSEVTPEYFAFLGAQPEADGRLSRRRYLDAVLGESPAAGHILGDIAHVTVALRADRGQRLVDVLSCLGYTVAADAGGSLLQGPDLTIRIQPTDLPDEGVRELGLRLSHPVPDEGLELSFDGCGLRGSAGSHTATWTFDPILA
jgi:hypothetical protein